MAIQLSIAVRNARLDSFETTTGASARLKMWSGSQPSACSDADSGTLIADLTLPADWMAAASGGSKALSGTWQDLSADNNGTIGHFRVYESTATTCHMQGSVTVGGGGGDMTVDNTVVVAGQAINVVTFTLTDANG